jgi:hypothetical protein
VHAQIRHQRILRRRGRTATRAAFRAAHGLWAGLSTSPGYTRQRDTRAVRMRSAGNATDDPEAIAEAAAYAETVALTAMLASPCWRAIAVTRTPAGNQRFHHEFRRRVAPDHHQDRYPRLLFWLRRDLEWHPGDIDETGPPAYLTLARQAT